MHYMFSYIITMLASLYIAVLQRLCFCGNSTLTATAVTLLLQFSRFVSCGVHNMLAFLQRSGHALGRVSVLQVHLAVALSNFEPACILVRHGNVFMQ
jgi:hypothetical protein